MTLIACAPDWTTPFFYRTAKGDEIDLILELPGSALRAIEAKRSLSPKVEAGFHRACDDLKLARRFVIYGGAANIAMSHGVENVSLYSLMDELVTVSVK